MRPSPLSPPKIAKPNQRLQWGNLPGSALSLAIAETAEQSGQFQLVITNDNLTTYRIEKELSFFLGEQSTIP